MRQSQLFSTTLREAPSEADAQAASHRWLLRAGFIRPLGAGIYSLLPLGFRAARKIEAIIRAEMNAIGGQELLMPVMHPADLWKETGRYYQIGDEMGRFRDRVGRDMVLAMTHEEVVTDLVRKEIRSYRQLPQLIYHLQTKWRDDPRPRAGLIRVREFTMKDSYSLDADWEGLDKQYRAHYQAYFNIFHRCGLDVIAVNSDVGMMGGKLAHEFMYLTPLGEDTLILCDACGYTANRQVARLRKPPAPGATGERGAAAPAEPRPLEKVATPGVNTIKGLAEFLNVPAAQTAKAVFLMATVTEGDQDVDKFVFAVVRGDMDLNETKLGNAVQAKDLRPAREEEIRAVGAAPGYASPVGLNPDKMIIVVDDLIPAAPNLVAGANEAGYHLLNTNYGRDYTAHLVADIVAAEAGSACPECGTPVRAERGVEVGNIFKLGTRYTNALGANYLDKDGQSKPVIMGSYGIGVGRLLACVAEAYNDADGLCWPVSVAPYQVHLMRLPGGEAAADDLYAALGRLGLEVLYDDRDERPGVKFKDADLLGLPLRVTVSERALKAGGVELKRRGVKDSRIVPLAEAAGAVQQEIKDLEAALGQRVAPVPYRE
ncbi:MAG: proline--tRNA ligase [Anaerolineales bacterium]|nr:proline--tRNA ligase [Anaerolineales bacterium]